MFVVISSNKCQLLCLAYADVGASIEFIDEELFGFALAWVDIFILLFFRLSWGISCSQSRESATYTHFRLLLFRNKHCASGHWGRIEGGACWNITSRKRREASKTSIASHSSRLWWLSDWTWGKCLILLRLRGSVLIVIEWRETLRAELRILIGVENSIVVQRIVIRHFVLISKWLR